MSRRQKYWFSKNKSGLCLVLLTQIILKIKGQKKMQKSVSISSKKGGKKTTPFFSKTFFM
jgi:hypothetical protein